MDKKELNSKVSADIKRNQDTVFLVVSLMISGALLAFLVAPTYNSRAALEKKNQQKQDELTSKQDLLKNIETFNKNNANLSVNSQKLEVLIPSKDNFEDFLIHIKGLSKDYNLELIDFNFSTAGESKSGVASSPAAAAAASAAKTENSGEDGTSKFNKQGISVTLRGDYSNFERFSKALENGIPFLQQYSVSISVPEITSQSQAPQTPQAPAGPENSQGSEKLKVDMNPLLEFKMELRFIYY